jgi:hypothetical protein
MTNRSLVLTAILGLTLVACDGYKPQQAVDAAAATKQAALDRDAMFEGEIMIGRVEVMQDQTRHGLEVLGLRAPEIPPIEGIQEREPVRRLHDTVGRYNHLREVACLGRAADGEVCKTAPYQPQWYTGAARRPSGTGLRQMAENVQDQMTPLWTSVCAKAQAKTGDKHLCAIE